MRHAWIGLGLIGLPMAARLASRATLQAFDIDATRRALAAERGIAIAASAEAAVAGAEILFTSLPSERVMLEVLGMLAGTLPRGAIVVETSTVGPQASATAATLLAPRGIDYLRAPISGSTTHAETGVLTTFVSGPKAAFEKARAAMQAYSRAQFWLGEGEEARYAKLSVNLVVAATAGVMGEALALARKGGIRWEAILEIMGESAIASPLVKYKLDPLRRRDFAPAATNALLLKDLELITRAAADAGVPAPMAQHVLALYRELVEGGHANEDFFSVIKVHEKQAGLGEP